MHENAFLKLYASTTLKTQIIKITFYLDLYVNTNSLPTEIY